MMDTCNQFRERVHIVVVGHVDHGKSTLIGRLLVDTNSLPVGKLDQIRCYCERNSKPFEYAFLIDALKDEQSQGITIDCARVFFKTQKRDYIINDAPGHIEFLKNMVTGASRATAALLVIDAVEGIRENSMRHGYMVSVIGVKQIAILVSKMDGVEYNQTVFDKIVEEYKDFLGQIGVTPICFIPVSGMMGDNIVSKSENMAWYQGLTVVELLDQVSAEIEDENLPFRMPVQDIYKFTKLGDTRRIIGGTIASGSVQVGDSVVLYPSGKRSRIKTIENYNKEGLNTAKAGEPAGFTLADQIYLVRGEIMGKLKEPPPLVTSLFNASLFWLGKSPLIMEKEYTLKLATTRCSASIEKIHRVLNSSSLEIHQDRERVEFLDIAECRVRLNRPIAYDLISTSSATGRFVLIDNYEIQGGGIIRESISDAQSEVQTRVFMRNFKWVPSEITGVERAQRYKQAAALILLTGQKDSGKKPIARKLEKALFQQGYLVYFIGIGNVLYGIDADIKTTGNGLGNKKEHLRRVAEVANLMLDAGLILIVTAIELNDDDIALFQTVMPETKMIKIWVGDPKSASINYDLNLRYTTEDEKAVETVIDKLKQERIIFGPGENERSGCF